MKKLMTCLALTFVVALAVTTSQVRAQVPPPVDLGIQNIPQDTLVWCWVAVAQQIVLASRGSNGTPPQCGLVAIASNAPPQYCCQMPAPGMRTGHLQEIRALILHFGGRFSSIAPTADPMTVYQTLASRRAIIMAVQPVLYVNDPMGNFTQPVPFINILPYWQAAIVVN